jgi:hypothetical protein
MSSFPCHTSILSSASLPDARCNGDRAPLGGCKRCFTQSPFGWAHPLIALSLDPRQSRASNWLYTELR